jgi:hypothetical protein
MTRRRRQLAVATSAVVAATSLGLAGAATQATAATTGTTLRPERSLCTNQIRADAGATLSGTSMVGRQSIIASWTVLVASTAGGSESEVGRTPLVPASVIPPVAGTWFFRGCVKNFQAYDITVTIQIKPN